MNQPGWASLVQLRYLVHHGYVYQRDEPVGGDSPAIMGKFPALFNMWRIHPELRKRVLGFDRFVRNGGMEKAIFQWRDQWKPETLERLKPLQAFEYATADTSALADHLDACYDYLCWSP